MIPLNSIEDLNACLAASEQGPVFIFKHSTACPISGGAHQRVTSFISKSGEETLPPFYMVKVIEARPVSNAIAEALGVRHQSPQLLLVKDRKALWNASHHGVHGEAIASALGEHLAGSQGAPRE